MPQFDYTHPVLKLGQIATSEPWSIDSYVNELLAQESEVTVGGSAIAGTYTIQVDGPEGTFTVDFVAAGGEAAAVVVAGFVTAIGMDPDFLNLLVAVDASPVLELNFLHPGQVYTVSFPSDPNGILTNATAQAAGGVDIGLGLGVVPGSSGQFIVAPTGATVDGDVLGITVAATVDIMVNDGLPTSEDVFLPGCTVSVLEAGECVVMTEDAVAFNGDVFMRIQNPGAGQSIGALRSDNAGGDAIQLTRAKFRSATTGAGLARVKIWRP